MKLFIPKTTTQITLSEDFTCRMPYFLRDTAERNKLEHPHNENEMLIPCGTVLEIRSYDLRLAASNKITFKLISIPQQNKVYGSTKTFDLSREEASKIEFELV